MRLEISDTRRLTGPNLWLDGPGPIIDVVIEGADADALEAAWRERVMALCAEMGWPEPEPVARHYVGGASLAWPAAIDVLYAACELNEQAWHEAVAEVTGEPAPDRKTTLAHIRSEAADEANPALIALEDEAAITGTPFLWDDDEVSLGLGRNAQVWPWQGVPETSAVDPDSQGRIPVVIVTGTNGKSTTVRMLATILRGAGISAGLTSTDGIHVGEEVVDSGDYSGPGGARTLLRHPKVEAAVLEVARGGLLRRGLPIERADVAVVTNIADDHLGEYGIDNLGDMAQAKLVVSKSVRRSGMLILNADDPQLVEHAPDDVVIGWCTQDPTNWTVVDHLNRGGMAWILEDGAIVEIVGARENRLVDVAAIPATLGGAARHNVANAMTAVAAARRLGVSGKDIDAALRGFRGDSVDNPGRANVFAWQDRTIVVDFAHNVAGITAIAETVQRMDAKRRLVMFGQAGDRGDQAIRDLARTVWTTGPDHIIAAEVPNYLRGRQPMEVPGLILDELKAAGAPTDAASTAPSPLAGVEQALAWSEPGDVLLLMVLEMREAAMALLVERGASPA